MQTNFIPGKEQLGKPAGHKKTSPVLPGTFLGCQKEIVQNQRVWPQVSRGLGCCYLDWSMTTSASG